MMNLKSWKLNFLIALSLLSGCNRIPGSDSEIHNFSVQHSGIATITNVYNNNGENCIDFLWQAENNAGKAEALTRVQAKNIEGSVRVIDLKVGNKLKLHVIHYFSQKGTTTPILQSSLWKIEQK
jgi:hypothetical protein